jgi:hypothetical protein
VRLKKAERAAGVGEARRPRAAVRRSTPLPRQPKFLETAEVIQVLPLLPLIDPFINVSIDVLEVVSLGDHVNADFGVLPPPTPPSTRLLLLYTQWMGGSGGQK